MSVFLSFPGACHSGCVKDSTCSNLLLGYLALLCSLAGGALLARGSSVDLSCNKDIDATAAAAGDCPSPLFFRLSGWALLEVSLVFRGQLIRLARRQRQSSSVEEAQQWLGGILQFSGSSLLLSFLGPGINCNWRHSNVVATVVGAFLVLLGSVFGSTFLVKPCCYNNNHRCCYLYSQVATTTNGETEQLPTDEHDLQEHQGQPSSSSQNSPAGTNGEDASYYTFFAIISSFIGGSLLAAASSGADCYWLLFHDPQTACEAVYDGRCLECGYIYFFLGWICILCGVLLLPVIFSLSTPNYWSNAMVVVGSFALRTWPNKIRMKCHPHEYYYLASNGDDVWIIWGYVLVVLGTLVGLVNWVQGCCRRGGRQHERLNELEETILEETTQQNNSPGSSASTTAWILAMGHAVLLLATFGNSEMVGSAFFILSLIFIFFVCTLPRRRQQRITVLVQDPDDSSGTELTMTGDGDFLESHDLALQVEDSAKDMADEDTSLTIESTS